MLGRSVRTSQPQGPCAVDRSNPITRGLRYSSSGLITPATSIVGTALKPSRFGQFRGFGTTFGVGTTDSIETNYATNDSQRTIFARIYVNGFGGGSLGRIVEKRVAGATSESFNLENTGGKSTLQFSRGWTTLGTWEAPNNTITAGNWYTVAVTYSDSSAANNAALYIDGVSQTVNRLNNATGSVVNNADNYVIGNRKNDNLRNFDGLIGPVYIFNRALSDAEIKSLSDNPWQVFASDSKSLWTPAAASVTLPTFVQPVGTVSTGSWTPTGAATLYGAINEVTPSDAEYISVTGANTCEMILEQAQYPGTANQVLSYYASSTNGSMITITLKQGTTTIMSRTHALTATNTLYNQTLTAPEIASIIAGPINVTLATS